MGKIAKQDRTVILRFSATNGRWQTPARRRCNNSTAQGSALGNRPNDSAALKGRNTDDKYLFHSVVPNRSVGGWTRARFIKRVLPFQGGAGLFGAVSRGVATGL